MPTQVGQAIFVTYKGKTGKMDEGYSEYSTCPVSQGERYLGRLVLREGEPVTQAAPTTRTSSSPYIASEAADNEEL